MFGTIYTNLLSVFVSGERTGLAKGEMKMDIFYYLIFF